MGNGSIGNCNKGNDGGGGGVCVCEKERECVCVRESVCVVVYESGRKEAVLTGSNLAKEKVVG